MFDVIIAFPRMNVGVATRQARVVEIRYLPPHTSLVQPKNPLAERAALQRELWTRVRQLIEVELTPHQRTILVAHVFHQKPLDLLAAELGTSRDAVYKAIHDARRKLRAALLARGVTVAEALGVFGKRSRP